MNELNYMIDCFFASYFQDYFEYIITKHEILPFNPPIQVYINKIKNNIIFKTKSGYYPQLFTPESIKLHRCSTEKKDKKTVNIFFN